MSYIYRVPVRALKGFQVYWLVCPDPVKPVEVECVPYLLLNKLFNYSVALTAPATFTKITSVAPGESS
jgi:hypothetical protein